MADPPENASFEAFAVIGAYFGLLHWIDESWVKANAERIFDLTVIERKPEERVRLGGLELVPGLGPGPRQPLPNSPATIRLRSKAR